MYFQTFITALDAAKKYNLDAVDLFVLNEVFCADNNSTTIMKIINHPNAAKSRVTLHAHIKKLCKDGFLIKKEDPQNMRYKRIEPGDTFKEFLVALKNVDGI